MNKKIKRYEHKYLSKNKQQSVLSQKSKRVVSREAVKSVKCCRELIFISFKNKKFVRDHESSFSRVVRKETLC